MLSEKSHWTQNGTMFVDLLNTKRVEPVVSRRITRGDGKCRTENNGPRSRAGKTIDGNG